MADPNKEKEQQASEEGYDYQKEVQSINDRYQQAEQNLSDSYTKQEKSVSDAYNAQIGGYDAFLSEVGEKKKELGIKSEEQEKRANAYRYIAGIGDAISGVANLVGTAHGADNQQQGYNAPGVMVKAEEMRKERKLEMEQLNARLDELRAQKAVLEGTRDLKLGELEGKKASELLGLELQKGRDIATAGQMEREEGWRKKNYEEGVRQFNEGQQLRKEQWEAQKSQWQKTYDLKLQEFKKAQEANMYNITLSGESFDIPKTKLNPGNVERIWKLLPQEVRDGVKGKTVTTYEADEYGQSQRKTSNEAPTTDQKLAAVVAYADYDGNVAAELKRLAEGADSEDKPKSNPADDPNL